MPFHPDRDSALFRRLFRLQAANKPATSWPRRWLHPGLTVDYTIEFARVLRGSSPDAAFSFLSGNGADPTGRSRMSFARYKGEAENALLAAGFPRVYIFRPAYIYPVEPRKEPNFGYRLMRAIYPAFRVLFPNQVIRVDELAEAMVDVAISGRGERPSLVLEKRAIRSLHKRPNARG